MTLFWHQTGPLIRYELGMLRVESLNPEKAVGFRMSRWEMFRLGWRCIGSAIKR
jgi:hypothetical protein